jgi:hypothetical protein
MATEIERLSIMLKKISVLLITIIGLAFSSCQTDNGNQFAIYLLAQDIPAAKLSQIDINQLILQNKPILSQDDILTYDKAGHTIELTQEAYTRLQQIFPMPVKVDGIPFVVCVGEERIYTGAFWTPVSSLSFDGPLILQPLDKTKTTIQISLGYPVQDVFTGNDPRGDPRIIKALEQGKKLK